MSEMTVSVPNEATLGTGTMEATAPVVVGGWGDMAKDLAALEKETGIPAMTPTQPELSAQAVVTPVAPAPVPAAQTALPTPTVPAVAVAAPVVPSAEVPEKFRGADGKLDQEKLLKSYTAIEKEFGRKANEVNALKTGNVAPQVPTPAQATQPQVPGNLTPLEIQVARDIFNGGGFTEAQAISVARTQVRLADAASGLAAERALGPVSQLMESQNEQRRVAELQSLAKNYPDVLTPKGYEELVKVREENPWINNSPEPWKAAAQLLVGQKGLTGQAGTVVIPTPMGAQPGQPLPVTPSSLTAASAIQLNTPQQIEAYVKTLTPAQEAEFWTKSGLKWDKPRVQFKGI